MFCLNFVSVTDGLATQHGQTGETYLKCKIIFCLINEGKMTQTNSRQKLRRIQKCPWKYQQDQNSFTINRHKKSFIIWIGFFVLVPPCVPQQMAQIPNLSCAPAKPTLIIRVHHFCLPLSIKFSGRTISCRKVQSWL